MTKRTTLAVMIFSLAVMNTTFGQTYRRQDAGFGGLAGAVVGGIIGHQNDETAEGAIIGGAVGAIAGSLFGEQKDRQVQNQRYYQQQAYRQAQHQSWQRQQVARAVAIDDVVRMTQSGLGDTVILNQIRTRGVTDRVGTHEIIAMHKSGVSESVITAMQDGQLRESAPLSSARHTSIARAPQPRRETVIVEQRPVVVREEVRVVPHPAYIPHHPRVRYATRPAIPRHPTRVGFHTYW